MKVYISGRVTNQPDFKQRFSDAEQTLISQGHEVVNPVNLPHDHDKSWQSYMKEDIKAMMDCEAIYLLSNWMQSTGAVIERALASELNFEIIHQ